MNLQIWAKWVAEINELLGGAEIQLRMGLYFMRVHRGQGFNFHAGANLPLLGSLSIQTQPNMRT